MLIVCILLALLCAGLAFWVWAQRRSLREAAYRLRALEDTGSTARVRLAVPNSAAEELLDEVNLRQSVLSRIGREMETRIALRMKGQARVEFIMFTGKYGVLAESAGARALCERLKLQ